jgi:capsular polysaccharide biosynthesis protein
MSSKQLLKYFFACASAFLLAYGFQRLFVSPEYEATTIIYPASTHYAEHLLDAGLRFGDEKESGEYIELLKSNSVLEALVTKHGLINHYPKIKSRGLVGAVAVLRDHITITRSPNRSLHVSVKDRDPLMAAQLSNSLIDAADQHLSDLIKGSIQKDLKVVQGILSAKQNEVKALKDSLEKLEAMGESKLVGEQFVKTPLYRMTETMYTAEAAKMMEFKHSSEKLNNTLKKSVPEAYIISLASPPDSPSNSKKFISSLLIGLIAALLWFVFDNKSFLKATR